MKLTKPIAYRIYSILGFAFLFAYLLSFLFEGPVLYGLLGILMQMLHLHNRSDCSAFRWTVYRRICFKNIGSLEK